MTAGEGVEWLHESTAVLGLRARAARRSGSCPQHDPYVAMRDALNATGRHIYYTVHAGTTPGSPNATVANSWRTGPDLYASSYDMWVNRLDLATTPSQAALAGPGAFPDPDFLEVR